MTIVDTRAETCPLEAGDRDRLVTIAQWEISGDLEWTSRRLFLDSMRMLAPALHCEPDEVVDQRWAQFKARVQARQQ